MHWAGWFRLNPPFRPQHARSHSRHADTRRSANDAIREVIDKANKAAAVAKGAREPTTQRVSWGQYPVRRVLHGVGDFWSRGAAYQSTHACV